MRTLYYGRNCQNCDIIFQPNCLTSTQKKSQTTSNAYAMTYCLSASDFCSQPSTIDRLILLICLFKWRKELQLCSSEDDFNHALSLVKALMASWVNVKHGRVWVSNIFQWSRQCFTVYISAAGFSMAGADGRWWQDVDIVDSLNLSPLSRGMHLWVFITVNASLFIQGGDW